MHDPITSLVVMIFSSPGTALIMAGAILVLGLGLVVYSDFTEYRPLKEALRERWNLLSGMRGTEDRKTFFKHFTDLNIRFGSIGSHSLATTALVTGWSNYRSLLSETENGIFATSIRANEAFDRLDEPARSLEWWANILVAIGLVVTFLGIVAALSEATSAMAQTGAANGVGMETALMGLLAIAATKFWTSIAGVLASIILRVVARFRRKNIQSLEASLFESLDNCVQFLPPEKVMLEQLKSLERIEALITHAKI